MIKLKNILPVIALGALVTACGGGSGTGVVTTSEPTVNPTIASVADRPSTMTFTDHLDMHDEGFTGTDMSVSSNIAMVGETRKIATANSYEFSQSYYGARGEQMIDENRRLVPNASVTNRSLDSDNVIVYDHTETDLTQAAKVNTYNAIGTAIVWDKFDTVSGTDLKAHVESTSDADGVINIERAMSPFGNVR